MDLSAGVPDTETTAVSRSHRPSSSVAHRWPALALLSVPALLALLGAWAYRWVDEDAFINFRIISNLLAGRGLVYNPGERVEADSDPLWVLSLAVLHVLTPFWSIEWLSVILGVALTTAAFALGGLAAWRLLGGDERSPVVPVGMLVVAVVPAVWEFSTSGLETSMVFAWLALCFWLLVRGLAHPRALWGAAVVVGLGTLIRPELALTSMILLVVVVALGVPVAKRSWRRAFGLVGASAAIPLIFELFRMAYYGLLVPNTALAKDAGAQWWGQGWRYLCNLVVPYALWLPLALGAVLVVVVLRDLLAARDRRRALVLVAPAAAGLAQVLWVTSIGGDYMHGRLLLPGLFALGLSMAVPITRLRGVCLVAVVIIVGWSVVCGGFLRFHTVPPRVLGLQTIFISDERASWITATKVAHPITTSDYARALSGAAGSALRVEAAAIQPPAQQLALITNPFLPVGRATRLPATSRLRFSLAVNVPGIGVVGYLSGPRVYVFDEFSLANPIGSHFVIVRHARPGHEKLVSPAWMLGRFLRPSTPIPTGVAGRQVAAARRAIGCGQLAGYLETITSPLTPSRALHSISSSLGWTTMSFSADPRLAEIELCGQP